MVGACAVGVCGAADLVRPLVAELLGCGLLLVLVLPAVAEEVGPGAAEVPVALGVADVGGSVTVVMLGTLPVTSVDVVDGSAPSVCTREVPQAAVSSTAEKATAYNVGLSIPETCRSAHVFDARVLPRSLRTSL